MADKSVADKLLIKPGSTLWVSDEARGDLLGPLPDGVEATGDPAKASTSIVIADDGESVRRRFATDGTALLGSGNLWVLYPKGNKADINRDSLWPILADSGSARSARSRSTRGGRRSASGPSSPGSNSSPAAASSRLLADPRAPGRHPPARGASVSTAAPRRVCRGQDGLGGGRGDLHDRGRARGGCRPRRGLRAVHGSRDVGPMGLQRHLGAGGRATRRGRHCPSSVRTDGTVYHCRIRRFEPGRALELVVKPALLTIINLRRSTRRRPAPASAMPSKSLVRSRGSSARPSRACTPSSFMERLPPWLGWPPIPTQIPTYVAMQRRSHRRNACGTGSDAGAGAAPRSRPTDLGRGRDRRREEPHTLIDLGGRHLPVPEDETTRGPVGILVRVPQPGHLHP